jgi:hypothetical protein
MNMNAKDFGENTQLWLDRLACGELDENTRKNLFIWLDAEPLRWRSCALALLEAQSWNESLEGITLTDDKETCGRELRRGQETGAELCQQPRAPRTAFRWAPLASLAAILLIAFSLGALSRGWLAPQVDAIVENKLPPASEHGIGQEQAGPLMATVSLPSEFGSEIPATLQIPVRSVRDSGPQVSIPISEFERHKWERLGYQLTKERRYLPAQLPDGKKVVVPVDQVKANYVGSKVS